MRLSDMELLLRVAETRSMSVAARQLRLTPAAVSATISRIESALGLRIFERSTRSLRPTEEGRSVLDGCHDVVERWQQTLEGLGEHTPELTGVVDIAAPSDTAYQMVAPVLAKVAQAHPGLQVVLHCGDALQQLRRDAIDLAVRYGKLVDSSLVARRVSLKPGLLVASPAYLERQGTPKNAEDLRNHRTITLQLSSKVMQHWALIGPHGSVDIELTRPLCADGYLARRWALEGEGISMKALFDVVDDLESGRLVQVLPDHRTAAIPIHTLVTSRRHVPARIRAVEQVLRTTLVEREHRCQAWLDGCP